MVAATLIRKYPDSSHYFDKEISILGQIVAATLTRKYLFYARQWLLLLHQGIDIILERAATSLKKASVFHLKQQPAILQRNIYSSQHSSYHSHKRHVPPPPAAAALIKGFHYFS